jgi:two-component system sensor histidine kinase AlgZ
MKTIFNYPAGRMTFARVTAHLLFWLAVYMMYTTLYSIPISYATSLRNNLFFVPLHVLYFYTLAYWLVPKYLFSGRYLWFVAFQILIMIFLVLASRTVVIYIANPYILSHEVVNQWDFIEQRRKPYWEQISNIQGLANAWKATNMIVWGALFIKLFKMWMERKQAALQAELNALKGQVHPHFLFNTLNNLYALTLNNSPNSPQVVLGLSDILRYMLYECNAEKVSLKQEVLVLQQYISLEKLRYEDRLDLNFTIEGSLDDKLIAPLIMLPFLENAFKHGASEKQGDAWININLAVRGNVLKFKVSNSKPEQIPANADKHYGHIGLQNVKKRLDLLYSGAYELKILNDDDAFLVVFELQLSHQKKPESQLIPA